MPKVLIGLIILAVCVFLFIFTYLLNKRTPKPEGCEKTECQGCNIMTCSNRVDKKENDK